MDDRERTILQTVKILLEDLTKTTLRQNELIENMGSDINELSLRVGVLEKYIEKQENGK